MSGEWTPGPWECVLSRKGCGAYVAGPHYGYICDCYAMAGDKVVPYQHERADANARLIAASPELAEALEAMVERFGHDIFTMPPADRELLTRAVKVLAKAKGEGA